MTQAFASPRLTGGFALLCGVALLPFVYVHLVAARLGGQSLAQAALEQLKADIAVGPPGSWLLLAWLALPFGWGMLAVAFFRTPGPAPTKGKALLLAALALLLGGLSVRWCGISTAPLFLAVPLLAAQMAFRLRPIR